MPLLHLRYPVAMVPAAWKSTRAVHSLIPLRLWPQHLRLQTISTSNADLAHLAHVLLVRFNTHQDVSCRQRSTGALTLTRRLWLSEHRRQDQWVPRAITRAWCSTNLRWRRPKTKIRSKIQRLWKPLHDIQLNAAPVSCPFPFFHQRPPVSIPFALIISVPSEYSQNPFLLMPSIIYLLFYGPWSLPLHFPRSTHTWFLYYCLVFSLISYHKECRLVV